MYNEKTRAEFESDVEIDSWWSKNRLVDMAETFSSENALLKAMLLEVVDFM